MSKPKKKRRLQRSRTMTVRELEQKRGRKLKRKPAKPGIRGDYVDDEELHDSDDCIAENRSQEPEHVIAHFERVYSTPGVAKALYSEALAVASAFEELAAEAVRRKGWNEGLARSVTSRLTQAFNIGATLRDRVGRGASDKPPPSLPPEALEALKRLWHELRALILDDVHAAFLVKHAFLLGWKRNKRTLGGAPKKTIGAALLGMLQRTPVVTDEGKLPQRPKERGVYYGADRTALHRLRKPFKPPKPVQSK